MVTEAVATELLRSRLSKAHIHRFLWASAFRLGQGQSATYRKRRWLLCEDAAHAMGPSAGAGMMVGMLGAWRLGWRLALAAKGNPEAENLLDDYNREQHAASKEVQNANATIFRNMAVSNPFISMARNAALRGLSHVKPLVRRMTEKEALVTQKLSVPGAEVSRKEPSTFR